jgi:hypothetical protein
MDPIATVGDFVRANGLVVTDPVDLRSTNNVVIWLAPSPVVAKISKEPDRAVRELKIVRALVELGAPVVPPFDFGPEQPVRLGETTVTFWRYEPQDDVVELDAAQLAHHLFFLHQKLAMLRGRIPLQSYDGPLRGAVRSLDSMKFAPELVAKDRLLLRRALVDGLSRLSPSARTEHVIHGSPHRLNIVAVNGVPSFLDFETVALGPLEWDLAHLEQEVADVYPAKVDPEVLALCRVMVSAATSTWCWEGVDRGPDMRSHAEHHLETVRSATR